MYCHVFVKHSVQYISHHFRVSAVLVKFINFGGPLGPELLESSTTHCCVAHSAPTQQLFTQLSNASLRDYWKHKS